MFSQLLLSGARAESGPETKASLGIWTVALVGKPAIQRGLALFGESPTPRFSPTEKDSPRVTSDSFELELYWTPVPKFDLQVTPGTDRAIITATREAVYLQYTGNSPPSDADRRALDDAVGELWLQLYQSHYPYSVDQARAVQEIVKKVPVQKVCPLGSETMHLLPNLVAESYAALPRWSSSDPFYLYWDQIGQWIIRSGSGSGLALDLLSPITHPDVAGALLLVEAAPLGEEHSLWVLDLFMFGGQVIDQPLAVWGRPAPFSQRSTLRDRLLQAERVQAAYHLIRDKSQPELWLHRTRGFATFDDLGPVLDGIVRLGQAQEAWFAPIQGRGPIYRLALPAETLLLESLRGVGYLLLRRNWERIDHVLMTSLPPGDRLTIYCLPTDAEFYRGLGQLTQYQVIRVVTSPAELAPPDETDGRDEEKEEAVGIFATWIWDSPEIWNRVWAGGGLRRIIFRVWDGPACTGTFRPLTGVHRDSVAFTETLAASARSEKPLPASAIGWVDSKAGAESGRLLLQIPGLVPAGTYSLGWVTDLERLGRVETAEHHLAGTNYFCSLKERWLSKLQRFGRIDMSRPGSPPPRAQGPESKREQKAGEAEGEAKEEAEPGLEMGPYQGLPDSKLLAGPHEHKAYRTAYTYVKNTSRPDAYTTIPNNRFVLPTLPTLAGTDISQIGAQWYEPVYRLATVADGTCLIHSVLQAAVLEYQALDPKEKLKMGQSVRRGLALYLEEKAPESPEGELVYTFADQGSNLSLFEQAGTDVKSQLYRDLYVHSLPGLRDLYRGNRFLGSETLAYLSYVFKVVIHQFVGYDKFGLREHIIYRTTAPGVELKDHIAIVGLGQHFETLAILRDGYLHTVFDEKDEFITEVPVPGKV